LSLIKIAQWWWSLCRGPLNLLMSCTLAFIDILSISLGKSYKRAQVPERGSGKAHQICIERNMHMKEKTNEAKDAQGTWWKSGCPRKTALRSQDRSSCRAFPSPRRAHFSHPFSCGARRIIFISEKMVFKMF